MSIEYRGEEFIYAVEFDKLVRPFNQTGGDTNLEADEIELDTKDKTGSDYGKITQNITLEGIITEGDPFVEKINDAIWDKELVKIYEINTRTKEAKSGMYMISSFSRSFSNGDFATYSLDGTLNGKPKDEILEEIPEGAPEEDKDNGENGGDVEG